MTSYPGGGPQVTTDTAVKQPRKVTKALRPFRAVLRTVTRGKGKR